MPVRFARLRIAGFKSFAEPVSVDILPGLTGIVGPNGCGKSNVVEALRWAMGEASAKSLRGGEMEDVIFAGSGARASRNIAEVTVTLEEAEGAAPPPFQELDELQISRRIERGNGSTYRINGREARARDVQTLFADLASGAQSSAMVGQGRVGALIAAKPEARRLLLEEAAGITGLHARRHEAELKLRAAEGNLARADDTRAQLDAQQASLAKQAKQARRWREMADLVRAAEADLLSLRRAAAEAAVQAAHAALDSARAEAETATDAARTAETGSAAAQDVLPALRGAEATARTSLERRRVEAEQAQAERDRAVAALAAAERQLARLDQDIAHATRLAEDATRAAATLDAEEAHLAVEDSGQAAETEAAETAASVAAEILAGVEGEAERATSAEATARAAHEASRAALAEAVLRLSRLVERRDAATAERDRLQARLVPGERIAEAEHGTADAATARDQAATEAQAAGARRQDSAAAQSQARARHAEADAAHARLAAEAAALREIIAGETTDASGGAPVLDLLHVPAGLEAALATVLGDTITAATTEDAPRHWRVLPAGDMPALPDGIEPLAKHVDAPPALARALGQVGLIDGDGGAHLAALAPGQSVVSRDGGLWRWDGYVALPGAPSVNAARLRQRNRLRDIARVLDEAGRAAAAARAERDDADAAANEAGAHELASVTRTREAEAEAARARAALDRLRAEARDAADRFALAEDHLGRLVAEVAEAEQARADAAAAAEAARDPADLAAAVVEIRARLMQARDADRAARAALDDLLRAARARAARRAAIAQETAQWRARETDARGRLDALAERRAEAGAECDALRALPDEIESRRSAIAAALANAEQAHRQAASALADAETEAGRRAAAHRAAEAALAAAREAAIRADADAGQADQALAGVESRIAERLGDDPLPPPAHPDQEEKLARRLDRLLRERDEMGPVNHLAEAELTELADRLAALGRERDEVAVAVTKLTGQLGALNKEGRERLGAVFATVDRHFQALFTRMFGGGKAHLALVGSDNPLEAGLEVYAQPPGKKLASLSLLSGGEQALTALSLIFAVFRCNPAPVCVLDEVDAPLDDANVERFCLLLEDMARETETRFLVVTHHPVTMARMDRLYGVTMQERGISRLLSVDLARATALAEAPRLAAE